MNREYLSDIDAGISNILRSVRGLYPETLFSAVEYSLFPGGKRVRPYLSYIVADFCGIDYKIIKPLALSIELIHNYSLIHDDLPCMDNDVIRRGKATTHVKYGEAMAVLTGDVMLNLAFEVLLRSIKENPELQESAALIAACAGGNGMIGGQAIELSNDTFDETLITDLCLKKTGALISAAINSVAILSYDRRKIFALSTYAGALGLAFQLKDDILDADKHETKSYLGVMGMDKTLEMHNKLIALIHRTMEPYGEDAKELIEFADMLAQRDE